MLVLTPLGMILHSLRPEYGIKGTPPRGEIAQKDTVVDQGQGGGSARAHQKVWNLKTSIDLQR